MRLFLLTTLTMIAFAANSVLTRLGLAPGDMDIVLFSVIRLVSGAAMLGLLVAFQKRGFAFGGGIRVWAVAALLAYIFGFSLAYDVLDPGFGALILFGVVQITMFAGALISKEHMPVTRWVGAMLAMAGLAWLLAPSDGDIAPAGPVLSMAIAGVGWGLYSLFGRGAGDPLQATAMNFILAVPPALVVLLTIGGYNAPAFGVVWAILSGAVTSGLGYALWYRILPELGASRAAVAQLSVPVIALLGGMLFLGEVLTMRFVVSAFLVMGGVALSLRTR